MITGKEPIAQIVEKYPFLGEIFMEYGLHCVSCHVAEVETLEEGCMSHGMDEKTYEMLLEDVNELIQDNLKKENPLK